MSATDVTAEPVPPARAGAIDARRGVASTRREPTSNVKRTARRWTRWLHVYTSMISLLLVLFFGLTGITLNHPDWTFGVEPTRTITSGVLPPEATVDGEVEFLVVAEHMRSEQGVRGQVKDFSADLGEGSITFKNPGYSATVFFDAATGEFELTEEQHGWLTVLNELHKGRDGNSSWRWVIDLSGGILVAIALSGIGVQLFLSKRRTSALAIAGVGSLVSLAFIWLTLT